MKGTAIITQQTSEKLVTALLNADNTFGPMGSGGFEIAEIDSVNNAKVIRLTECDCAPAISYLAFINKGTIYANKIAGVIMGVLNSQSIPFKTKIEVNPPPHISSYLKKKTKR